MDYNCIILFSHSSAMWVDLKCRSNNTFNSLHAG